MAEELVIPSVTWEQIQAFRDAHFTPNSAASAFFANFIPQSAGAVGQTSAYNSGYNAGVNGEETEIIEEEILEEAEEVEEEEEDLGFYPDGVRRTLTDEQIAIFRHSEIQELLKAQRRKLEAKREKSVTPEPEYEEPPAPKTATKRPYGDIAGGNEDYVPRQRPTANVSSNNDSASLPWDDEDVGNWNNVQSTATTAAAAAPAPGAASTEDEIITAKPRKPRAIKPTFDAPSGMQFFWPVIEKS
ncbi:hypothetical protein DFH27DRAFT_610831 [Peziza echinospora]|nr:hypothetical protein DFH27DRAFT_610831 [Peziza echinospora]